MTNGHKKGRVFPPDSGCYLTFRSTRPHQAGDFDVQAITIGLEYIARIEQVFPAAGELAGNPGGVIGAVECHQHDFIRGLAQEGKLFVLYEDFSIAAMPDGLGGVP